ncbi:MAG: prepilin-type N-terminal cleavage/methylation domain-containing protein [Candidatus Marinimicrobia bacterium]|nr:prepilin-type N-terminal cleavage/methylation domain-containing protein [Candidatus Neomarinimicrobiota bacterium]MCF7904400.1 prepilin-type N-terminal cleavage/methylation domain-containing protein [Candidatus Neomarinimicrobiota bacterium]
MKRKGSTGTTLPEIMIALVIAGIVAIGYGSMLLYTRTMYNNTVIRSQLSQDALIIDQYIRSNLTLQISDSLKIYADSTAENAGTPSSSGTVMRAMRIDNTVDHVEVISSQLVWEIDSLQHYPIDSDVASILFTSYAGNNTDMLDVDIQLVESTDTLDLTWTVSIRN